MKYGEKINDYYNKDQFIGSFEVETDDIGTGLVGAPACGDVMKLQLKIKNDKIIDARILVFGCGSARASSNYAAEMLIGKTLQEAESIKDEDIADALDLPKIKMHCSVLAESAIKKAIKNYREKQEKSLQKNTVATFELEISPQAADFIKKVLSKSDKKYLGVKINLEESGCGMSYKITQVNEGADISSYSICKKDNLTFFAAKEVVEIINCTTMSYKEDGLQVGIVFTNPNEVGRCGCGSNFKLSTTKKDDSCSS
jgi:iron-sulfur cluster assembly accessory protein